MAFTVAIDPVLFMGKKELAIYTEKAIERYADLKENDLESFNKIFGQFTDDFSNNEVPDPEAGDVAGDEDPGGLTDGETEAAKWIALLEFNTIVGTRRNWGKQRKKIQEQKKEDKKESDREYARSIAIMEARARARNKSAEKRASRRRK